MDWTNNGAAAPENPNWVEFDDDVVTEEQFKELTSPRLLPVGQYRFKVNKVERVAPTPEKRGGDKVVLTVVMAPAGTNVPEGGWPPASILFPKYFPGTATEGQKKNEAGGKRDKAAFIKACGIDGATNLGLALKSCEGQELLASVTHREVEGQTYQDVKAFRPLP